MDERKVLEEKLLEVCSLGDHDAVVHLVQKKGVPVNSQHAINGWSPLHWAAKRGHTSIVSFLLASGADKNIKNDKDQTPLDLTANKTIRELLGGDPNVEVPAEPLAIQPNYLKHPTFPYAASNIPRSEDMNGSGGDQAVSHSGSGMLAQRPTLDDELVIKARVANVPETDFIEVELPWDHLSYYHLVDTLCKELKVEPSLIQKVRKLPNTIVRKDKDVQRLKPFTEMELVLTSRAHSQASRNYGPQPRHVDVVY